MTAKKHPTLNQISVVDKFRVKAYNAALGYFFVFQVVGPRDSRPPQFSCHIYDSASLDHPGYIETATVPSDGVVGGSIRSLGTAATLDDLVHNLDWAHLPSELAQLRALLSTCVTTDTGTPIGELVMRRASDVEFTAQQEASRRRAEEMVRNQADSLAKLALSAVSTAAEQARTAARFGLREDIKVSFSTAAPV